MRTLLRRSAALLTVLALLGVAACSDDEPEAQDRDGDDAATAEWELTDQGQAKDIDRAGEAPPALRPFIALLCRSAGQADTFGITPERIQDTLVGPNRSIDGYLKEMSYGALSIAGSRAAGWFDLPKASNAYADSVAGVHEITRDCAAAATAGGVDLGPFGNVMVFTNGDLNGALGTTTSRAPITVGGQPRDVTTIVLGQRALNSPPLVLHELGHVIGGTHTSSPTDPLGGGAGLGDRFTVSWPEPVGSTRRAPSSATSTPTPRRGAASPGARPAPCSPTTPAPSSGPGPGPTSIVTTWSPSPSPPCPTWPPPPSRRRRLALGRSANCDPGPPVRGTRVAVWGPSASVHLHLRGEAPPGRVHARPGQGCRVGR